MTTSPKSPSIPEPWPRLPHEAWADTIETLHMWSQIVGKVRMELSPWINHSWSVPLYVTPRGLTTSPIPYGEGTFQIDFDFIDHRLDVVSRERGTESFDLGPITVADFYTKLFDTLKGLEIDVRISTQPCEVPTPIRFPEDSVHGSYDPDHVHALHGALSSAHRVMTDFRSRFTGKVSPVHLFWGAFDLAVTRFSGRTAPEHPGGIPNLADAVTREAYSHEVSSAGFWVGNREAPNPVFYSYAYPTPDGFPEAKVRPEGAFWFKDLGEFLLPYETVRGAASPEDALTAFFQSTYEAAADLARWDRKSLEWAPGYRPLERRAPGVVHSLSSGPLPSGPGSSPASSRSS